MEVEMEREKKMQVVSNLGRNWSGKFDGYGDWDVLMKRENVNDKSQVSGLHHSDWYKPIQTTNIH